MLSTSSCPRKTDPTPQRKSSCFRETKPSSSCNNTWNYITAGLKHRYGCIKTCSSTSKQGFVSASQVFCTNWTAMPAAVLFAAFRMMSSFSFQLLCPPKRLHEIRLCLEHYRHAHFIPSLRVCVIIIKDQLQDPYPVKQSDRNNCSCNRQQRRGFQSAGDRGAPASPFSGTGAHSDHSSSSKTSLPSSPWLL